MDDSKLRLVLKKNENEKLIELKDLNGFTNVVIDGEVVATFYNNGVFHFFGQKGGAQFEGRWDK